MISIIGIFTILLNILFSNFCLTERSLEDVLIDSTDEGNYYPIVILPGDGGSRAYSIDLKLRRKRLIWFSLEYMFLPHNLKNEFLLTYNSTSGQTKDRKGYKIIFPGWGDTENIENLNTWRYSKTAYFQELVSKLLENPFYIRNKTLRGAPYDFRKAPYENKKFMKKFRRLVEDTYEKSGKKKIVLVAHSLGCLYALHFFKFMKKYWKNKYIKSFVATAAPIGGSIKALLLEISGSSFGIPRNPSTFRDIERSFSSTAYLLPRPSQFPVKQVIVQTRQKNYTVLDYFSLFKDLGFDIGYNMYLSSTKYYDVDEALDGVSEIHCVHGTNVSTPALLRFTENFPGNYPQIEYGNGDGSVNLNSLRACRSWTGVRYTEMANVNHKDILSNHKYIEYIKMIAMRL